MPSEYNSRPLELFGFKPSAQIFNQQNSTLPKPAQPNKNMKLLKKETSHQSCLQILLFFLVYASFVHLSHSPQLLLFYTHDST